LVSPDGYIITNDHVVEGSKVVTVTLSDGREYYGSVLEDHQSDLAVVKIDAPNVTFPCCKFADSDKVETGQWSIAIGSPFDLRNTMTVGFISATHRKQIIPSLASARFYPDLIQTDAAINPGNSGGPLFDANGEVVGINVAIESSVDSSAGIGFAIPANFAKSIMQQLIKNGKVTRGYLGITPAELTPAKQEIYGVNAGSWVQEVDSDSPAGRAGIHAGDIIESFAGKPVDGELSLRMAIMQEAPGESAAINLIRNGKPLSYSVVLAAPPQIPTAESGVASTPPIDQKKIGVSVRNLTDSDRDQDKLSPDTVGALVTNVLLNSPAEQAGLLPGDIITHIGKHEIKTALDAANALNELVPGKEMIMIVLHSTAPGKTLEIALDLKTWK
jgi:serine protease Do